jgi:hypothetical protein
MPENSNMAIVQFGRDSSFLAWTCPATVEIFSAEMARAVPLSRSEPETPLEPGDVAWPYFRVD